MGRNLCVFFFWKTRGWDLLKKIMIGILLHELLHLNEYQEECGVSLYKETEYSTKINNYVI
ncbi:hypothetical protein COK69_21455 [Bacillus cereus]|nr:hypothetical protein BKK44_10810 [Bacillus cereus]PFU31348.1 hypothetical protein COK69_21455 [Bacillus cereus]